MSILIMLLHCNEEFVLTGHGASANTQVLAGWAELADKPTILFIDEIDSLIGDSLLSVLRQI